MPLAAGCGLTRDQAFAVQAAISAEFGPVGGFKVACPPGAPMVIAPIYEKDILPGPARFSFPAGTQVGIELEYAFRLTAPLPPTQASDFKDRLRRSVDLLPVIELVHSRIEDPKAADAMLKLADNQINGALALGLPVSDWRAFDVTQASGHLRAGNEVLLDGLAQVPGGDAFETLHKLTLEIGDHCGGLQPGQVVITGSLNGLPWVAPEGDVHGRIDGLGEVYLSLSAN